MVLEPLDAVIEWVAASTADQVSVHHAHIPIIDFVSNTEARVVWAMEDRLYRSETNPLADNMLYLHGSGHYHETYVKVVGAWRLRSSRLSRLRVEEYAMAPDARVSPI